MTDENTSVEDAPEAEGTPEAKPVDEAVNTLFTTRDLPWMHLGNVVNEAQSLEDAIKLADLDWEVELRKDGFQTASGNWRIDPSKRKVVRSDNEQPLGTVSSTYEVLQYREAFDFMAGIDLGFVAGGQLKGGKQAFIVVQIPQHEHLTVLDNDGHQMYVVLRTSHDGSRAVEVNYMALRDACMNALTLSTFGRGIGYGGQAKQRWSIRHTKNMRAKLEQAQQVLTGAEDYAQEFADVANRLAAVELEMKDAERLIRNLVKDQHGYVKDQGAYVQGIMSTYENSTRNGYQGNGWGLVNAVSEHYEHVRGGERRTAEARWVQDFDGLTHKAVDRAAQLVLAR